MAFRYGGTAWDGQLWETCAAITRLGLEVEQVRPGTFGGDGTVASEGHDAANPNSDHTVWPRDLDPPGVGLVYAIDIGETSSLSVDALFEGFRIARDARIKYAIHDRRLFSSYPAHGYASFTWRPYSGYNAHLTHGHVSVHHAPVYADDSSPWITTPGDPMFTEYVLDLQRDLNKLGFTDKNGNPLDENGEWNAKTRQAHRRMMRAAARVDGAKPTTIEILAPPIED